MLADDIRSLWERALADLNAAHDYYTETKYAWRVVRKVVKAGRTFTLRNQATGSVARQAELAARAKRYVTGPLAEATFQQFVLIFEYYFFDLLRLWLLTYPRNLIGEKVDFKIVSDAAIAKVQ